ncbi:MAG: glutamate racemase [Desulfobulbaceae bacterium]|uniref:Glutamate racemase n=1 Tax=Candidatus Desulfobia pelagia TaxID=2841692 RepID=A0A8J6NDH1_9BACT|nr:glutamate racemase [Candidatus Desulfobia pelagia]
MIGVFDSGVGGMTVASAIEQVLPDKQLIYFGDLARAPYGSKSPETIRRYAIENTEFLISKGATLIIVACNSAASVASDILQSTFDQPVFEVITPAIDRAIAVSRTGRIGVIGTRATIKSGVYEQEIKRKRTECKIFSEPCPMLVPLVEEGWLNKRETKMITRRYLHPLKMKNVDTLLLGCTHYPLLKHLIQPRIGKRVKVIDSSHEVAKRLHDFLESRPELSRSLEKKTENTYYVSDVTDAASMTAQRIFGRKIKLNKI